jgi:hypothetical protein
MPYHWGNCEIIVFLECGTDSTVLPQLQYVSMQILYANLCFYFRQKGVQTDEEIVILQYEHYSTSNPASISQLPTLSSMNI